MLSPGGIAWHDPDPTDLLLLANATGLTPYDASYLWLAGFLGADLVTLDRRLAPAHDAPAEWRSTVPGSEERVRARRHQSSDADDLGG